MTPEQLEARIVALLDTCTYTVFNYTRRGLFDRDKLIVLTLLTSRSCCVVVALIWLSTRPSARAHAARHHHQ